MEACGLIHDAVMNLRDEACVLDKLWNEIGSMERE